MQRKEPTIETLAVTEARKQFGQLMNRVFKTGDRLIIEKNGIPVAAIISAQELERFAWLEAERKRAFAPILEVSEAFKDVPDEELERQVALALAEVRAENRRERESKSA